jgi:hypothetical protein
MLIIVEIIFNLILRSYLCNMIKMRCIQIQSKIAKKNKHNWIRNQSIHKYQNKVKLFDHV